MTGICFYTVLKWKQIKLDATNILNLKAWAMFILEGVRIYRRNQRYTTFEDTTQTQPGIKSYGNWTRGDTDARFSYFLGQR